MPTERSPSAERLAAAGPHRCFRRSLPGVRCRRGGVQILSYRPAVIGGLRYGRSAYHSMRHTPVPAVPTKRRPSSSTVAESPAAIPEGTTTSSQCGRPGRNRKTPN